jgi:hypothetical protein
MAAPRPPELVAAARQSAAVRRCTGLTRRRARCRRRAIRGATRCRLHLGPSKAHDRFHDRRLDDFQAGRLSPADWNRQQQRRARARLAGRLAARSASRWPEPGLTLAFSAVLEERFRQDLERHLRQHDRIWEDVPDAHRDRLRWNWRRYKLDRPGAVGDQAWGAKADYLIIDIEGREKKWPQHRPENYAHVPDDGGNVPWVIHVAARPVRGDRLKPITQAELDKALALPAKTAARYARTPKKGGWPKGWKRYGPGGKRRPPDDGLDVSSFLQEHARALAPLIARCPDEAQLKRLAVGYRALLAGGVHERWIALVRGLGVG